MTILCKVSVGMLPVALVVMLFMISVAAPPLVSVAILQVFCEAKA